MRATSWLAIGGSLAAMLAAPVTAQPARLGTERLALEAMWNFARCIADRHPGTARTTLELDPGTSEYSAAVRRLAQGGSDCAVSSTLQFNHMLFTGGMAEGLLFPSRRRIRLAPLVAYNPQLPPVSPRSHVEFMGLCVARTAPDEVEAILAAMPGSDAEATAMGAIRPRLGECLVTGQQANMNAPALRSVLALAAYRLWQHNRAAQAPTRN